LALGAGHRVRGHQTVVEYQIEVRRERDMRELFLRLEPAPALASADALAAVLALVLDDLHRQLQLRLDGEVVPAGTLPRFELTTRARDYSHMIITICHNAVSRAQIPRRMGRGAE
jgi:AMP-binding enzyme C-terminal domain